MAWRIIKQPNGLLARFSDVVDDFTDYDLGKIEAIELCMNEHRLLQSEAIRKVNRGVFDAPIPGFVERTADDGLDRWRQAIARIRAAHGDAVAEKRIEQLSTPRDATP